MPKLVTSNADLREMLGLLLNNEGGLNKVAARSESQAVKDVFLQHNEGDLRYWSQFSEVVAWAYDPDTCEVLAVARSDDFFGDPTEALKAQLAAAGDFPNFEVWGRSFKSSGLNQPGTPSCLSAEGRRPSSDDLQAMVDKAFSGEEPAPAPKM